MDFIRIGYISYVYLFQYLVTRIHMRLRNRKDNVLKAPLLYLNILHVGTHLFWLFRYYNYCHDFPPNDLGLSGRESIIYTRSKCLIQQGDEMMEPFAQRWWYKYIDM